MTSEDFGKHLEVLTTMLLERGNDGVNQKEYRGFIHVATQCMRDAFRDGESGSGATADLIAEMENLNNPLSAAIVSAMKWSFEQGQKARV